MEIMRSIWHQSKNTDKTYIYKVRKYPSSSSSIVSKNYMNVANLFVNVEKLDRCWSLYRVAAVSSCCCLFFFHGEPDENKNCCREMNIKNDNSTK